MIVYPALLIGAAVLLLALVVLVSGAWEFWWGHHGRHS